MAAGYATQAGVLVVRSTPPTIAEDMRPLLEAGVPETLRPVPIDPSLLLGADAADEAA